LPTKTEKPKGGKKKRGPAPVKEVEEEEEYYDEEDEEEGKQVVIAQKVKRTGEGDFSNEAKQMKRRAQQARAPSVMKVNDDENEDEAEFMQPKGRHSAVKRSQSVMGGGPSRSAKLGNA